MRISTFLHPQDLVIDGQHLTELRANNDIAIIKTDELYEDSKLLFPIMKHYIENSRYITPVIQGLHKYLLM